MRRRAQVIDLGIGALAFAVTLAILAARGLGTPNLHDRALDLPGVLLAAASTLPLAARRRFPTAAFLIIAAASLALIGLAYPLDAPIGATAGAYTLGAVYGGQRRSSRRVTATLAVAAFIPAVAAVYAVTGVDVPRISMDLLFWAAVLAGLWIVGDRTRLRAERISELAEQARRVEREAQHERRLAAAEERTRIARDLHDSAGHAINVILVQAGAARLLHQRDPQRSQLAIGVIEQVARGLIEEIDGLIHALRDDVAPGPSTPGDELAIADVLRQHEAAGLRISADIQGSRPALPASVAWATHRILREAFTNATRHGTGSAELTLVFGAEELTITVTNPVPAAPPSGAGDRRGHGILGMRERAGMLGGALDIGARGDTFRLHARLPYGGLTPAQNAQQTHDAHDAHDAQDMQNAPGAHRAPGGRRPGAASIGAAAS
ncbi:histidine kinase [Dactylosporangium sp. CA-139114]|uniref:sensor histidine kinase n=1 Tax=Dactylosporangium sp. CA-139114 TaxID=3239931 RepID=UPI003D956062